MGFTGIMKIVDELVYRYKTNVPSEICELLNIDIKETYSIKDIACIFNVFNTTTIFLNKSIKEEFRELALAHELGHERVGHISNDPLFIKQCNMANRQELQADFFAVYLFLHKKDRVLQENYINTDEFKNQIEYYLNKFKEVRG